MVYLLDFKNSLPLICLSCAMTALYYIFWLYSFSCLQCKIHIHSLFSSSPSLCLLSTCCVPGFVVGTDATSLSNMVAAAWSVVQRGGTESYGTCLPPFLPSCLGTLPSLLLFWLDFLLLSEINPPLCIGSLPLSSSQGLMPAILSFLSFSTGLVPLWWGKSFPCFIFSSN